MKLKYKVIMVCLIVAIIAALIYIAVLSSDYKRLRSSLPHLLIGDKISYFDLKGVDTGDISADILNESEPGISVVFIFDRPCTACSKNILFWNKLVAAGKETYAANISCLDVVHHWLERFLCIKFRQCRNNRLE